jgi:very-short-patch-repair endonuclease
VPRRVAPPVLPPLAVELATGQRGLLTTRQLTRIGLDRNAIQRLADHGITTRIHRGVWSTVSALDLETRVLAATLALGAGVACLQTAVTLHGLAGGPADPRIHISLPPRRTRHQLAGVARHWLELSPEDVHEVRGLQVTRPERLVIDAARRWPGEDVVSLADSALNRGLLAAPDLAVLCSRLSPAEASWLRLADASAESPLETRMRLLLGRHGLGALFEPQWEVRAGGRVVGRIDFANPALKLGIECDGRGPHELPEALFRDRWRADDLAALGWRLIRVTWDDVVRRPQVVVGRIRRALAGAA